ARREQHPQRARPAKPQIGERRRRQAGEQYRAPSDPIAEPAPERRGYELGERIGCEQCRHLLWRGGEAHRIKWQQRDGETEPDKVDKDDEKQGRHRPDIAYPSQRGKARVAAARYLTVRRGYGLSIAGKLRNSRYK